MRASLALRGGFIMMSTSGGLKLSAVAGGPSVIRFTQRSWTGISASGIPRAAVRNMLKKKQDVNNEQTPSMSSPVL